MAATNPGFSTYPYSDSFASHFFCWCERKRTLFYNSSFPFLELRVMLLHSMVTLALSGFSLPPHWLLPCCGVTCIVYNLSTPKAALDNRWSCGTWTKAADNSKNCTIDWPMVTTAPLFPVIPRKTFQVTASCNSLNSCALLWTAGRRSVWLKNELRSVVRPIRTILFSVKTPCVLSFLKDNASLCKLHTAEFPWASPSE